MIKFGKLRRRFGALLDREVRPALPGLRARIHRRLAGRLAAEDSPDKTAIVIAGSIWLARALGLHRTRLLILEYPDFTLENLALLSDEYDFVISDRALHRCDELADMARETMRILKPGGWFVHTTAWLDVMLGAGFGWRRFLPSRLRLLFTHAGGLAGRGVFLGGWVIGYKATHAHIEPTVVTRTLPRQRYRFAPRPAKFGVMAIVRNEAPYLLEWIAHYRVLGFEQITIYDHQSNDATRRILAPLAQAGIINAHSWTDRGNLQHRAYDHALRRLRPFVEWCLFADLDEFLVLDPGLTIADLLPKERDVSAVGIPWRIFGSDGQRNRGTGLVIERFTKAAPSFHRLVKSLVRLEDALAMGIHVPRKMKGRATDIAGEPLDFQTPRTAPSIARINHYFNRSWEEFVSKRLRGDIASRTETYPESAFDRYGAGEAELLDALPLAPLVKAEIERLRRIVTPARAVDESEVP